MTGGLVSNAVPFAAFIDCSGHCAGDPIHLICTLFLWLDLVPAGEWLVAVETSRKLIDQMVTDISLQTNQLDACRLRLFLRWLKSHSSEVRKTEGTLVEARAPNKPRACERLKDALKLWFESLPESGWLWEYQLILTEINWWRFLDEQSLVRILKDDEE